MAKPERIGAEHFFSEGTFCGLCIGLMIVFTGLLIYANENPVSENKKALEFKKYLFYAAASKLNELNEKGDAININSAMYTANFLKNELEKGNTIENIIGEEMKARTILGGISNSDDRKKTASLLAVQGSRDIIAFAQSDEWKTFRNNPENIKIFKELVAGGGKIPEVVYPKKNITMIFWITIVIVQISIFIGYLVGMHDFYSVKWHHLQWGKIGTYIVIAMLSPGMWVIVTPWLLWKFVSFDFSGFIFIREQKKAKLIKKEEARKAIEKSFDPNFLREKFSKHRKESENLLEKLESKLQKERGTA